MALKFTVERLEDVPEAQRGLYAEKDGKFVLDVDGGVEDVAGLKSALEKERQARREAERAAKAKETEEEQRKAAAEKAEMERKGEWEKLRQTVEAEKATLVKERDAALEGLKAHLIKAHVSAAIAEHKGNIHLSKLVEDQFEAIISPDGAHKVVVKGDASKTPAQYIEALKKDASYGAFFEGAQTSGGGANQNRGGGGGDANPWKKETWNLTKQGEIQEADPARAKALAAEAGRTIA